MSQSIDLSTDLQTEESYSQKEARVMHSFTRHRPRRGFRDASQKNKRAGPSMGAGATIWGNGSMKHFRLEGCFVSSGREPSTWPACSLEIRCWMSAAVQEHW